MLKPFSQVDVFTAQAFSGNPLAVIHAADGLDTAQMAAIARWTNLSETTFLLKPQDARADYRVRIFTPGGELPFAGHPTLGSAYAWVHAGGSAKQPHEIIQQCEVGLIRIRRDEAYWSFAAPPLIRTGALDEAHLATLLAALDLQPHEVIAHQWVDNGPGWCVLWLDSATRVLSRQADHPDLKQFKLGLIGAYPKEATVGADFEVRAFVGGLGVPEDPVTGSLNAGIACWLLRDKHVVGSYVVSQGTCLQRQGRVLISSDADTIWVGGQVTPVIEGRIQIPAIADIPNHN